MASNFTQPLDLESLLIDSFAGGYDLFLFLALMIIAIMGARFRMPNIVLGSMVVVFIVMISTTSDVGEGVFKGVLLLIVVGLGLLVGRTLTKISDR